MSKVVHNGVEMPRAYVVRCSHLLSEDDVIDFSRRQLISYKALTGGVVFVQQIPRLPSGKIQRYKLVELPVEVCAPGNENEKARTEQSCAQSTRILERLVRRASLSGSWVLGLLTTEHWHPVEYWNPWQTSSIGLLSCGIGLGIWCMRVYLDGDPKR